MSQSSEYLESLHYDLGSLYLIIQRDNYFYLEIHKSVTRVYYAKSIRIKNLTFDIFQKFIQ